MAASLVQRKLNHVRAAILLAASLLSQPATAELRMSDDSPLALPAPGSYQLRLLTPSILELTLITTKAPDPSKVASWDFVTEDGKARAPQPKEFEVLADGQRLSVQSVGFKRRVLYAPLKKRDLRIANYLYLRLARPIADAQSVEVKNPGGKLWSSNVQFTTKVDPFRWSPALHVNQVGYLPAFPKKAMVGYYLGSLGEMSPGGPKSDEAAAFKILEANSSREVFQGRLAKRPDKGFTFSTYQQVFEADFSNFKTPGEYRFHVLGLGVSFPFWIEEGVAAAFARTYALGLYHQRCGAANELPFTRHTHGACHLAPAEVPTLQFTNAHFFLAQSTADYTNNPRHTAPQLKDVTRSLYPFVKQGELDVSGGHHDAGDYSKYTINSAGLLHHLMVAVDAFPGVGELDNLGLPESGDGKSDVLQEAKWEADFLARMQDTDGGFYFLVYPRNRRYENNVTPDKGDSQIVWPKNTSATAASVAVLAQCASSPRFKKQFPEAASGYLAQAKKGWAFLEAAIAKHGKDGAYQKLSHYGDEFMHDDELAWAACEMFVATGEAAYHKKLREWFDPADAGTRKWSWWRLYEGYGCAIRSYAFAAKAGKLKPDQLDVAFLSRCESEIEAAGADQLRRAEESAYGTSFPSETKRTRSAGWYFSGDAAFDLAVASQLDYPAMKDPRPKFLEALLSNLNYEGGCNPVNVTYVTGLGWKRQREIVHQYAVNDRRVLPPAGIPIGNIQAGFAWLDHYKKELGALSFPWDGAEGSPYPFYDRWGDSFNVSTEFVVLNQARNLGTWAWLMAKTPLKDQAAKPVVAEIEIQNPKSKIQNADYVASLRVPGIDLQRARILWEAQEHEPAFGAAFTFTPANSGPFWVEAEALLPDGRRIFAATNIFMRAVPQAKASR